MIKLMLMVRRKAGTTPAEFKAHYESTHAPLAASCFTGMVGYTRNYLSSLPGQPVPQFDCITELCFKDRASLEAMMKWNHSEEGQVMARDEAQFMDRSSMTAFIAEEVTSDLGAGSEP